MSTRFVVSTAAEYVKESLVAPPPSNQTFTLSPGLVPETAPFSVR